MLTQEIKVEKKEKKEFAPLPENFYQVELLDIDSEVRPTYKTRNEPKENQILETILKFQFTLLSGKDKDGSSLRGRNVWENFVPTYLYEGKNGKNKLYQITEALLGHNLTQKEEMEMDTTFLNSLIGSQCRLGIKNTKSGDKVYSNIETYYPIEQEMTALSEEEKEVARVKDKTKDEDAEKQLLEMTGEVVIDDANPFG